MKKIIILFIIFMATASCVFTFENLIPLENMRPNFRFQFSGESVGHQFGFGNGKELKVLYFDLDDNYNFEIIFEMEENGTYGIVLGIYNIDEVLIGSYVNMDYPRENIRLDYQKKTEKNTFIYYFGDKIKIDQLYKYPLRKGPGWWDKMEPKFFSVYIIRHGMG